VVSGINRNAYNSSLSPDARENPPDFSREIGKAAGIAFIDKSQAFRS
jgi:hypothetical protein